MLSRFLAFGTSPSTCLRNRSVGLKVIHKILGFRSTGRGVPFMITTGLTPPDESVRWEN